MSAMTISMPAPLQMRGGVQSKLDSAVEAIRHEIVVF